MMLILCRPRMGTKAWRRSMFWMLGTMHSNLSVYIWIVYFVLTYAVCREDYLAKGATEWDYIQLLILGCLRVGMYANVMHIIAAAVTIKSYI